ncbi:MAG: primosomal protein N' [Patescibacteria group bacterium]|nr:primosomal protein N' [Patescibacteria group bacterium]
MIAKVIPSLRLPRDLSVFDYLIPENIKTNIKIGSVVLIPFRNKKVYGLVKKLTAQSSAGKRALKPVSRVISNITYTPGQLKLLEDFADRFFVSPATALTLFLNTLPRKIEPASVNTKPRLNFKKDNDTIIKHDELWLYNDSESKESLLKKTVKSFLASGKTVLLVAPEIRLVKDWVKFLAEFSPIPIHRQLPPKLFWSNYQLIQNRTPVLVVGTRTSLFLPYQNLGLVVIDEEDNQNHRQAEQNPRFHTEQVSEILSTITGCRIIFISQVPRVTTWSKVKDGRLVLKDLRLPIKALKPILVNLTDERKLGKYTPISDMFEGFIKTSLADRKRLFILVNRLGESTGLVCSDCGYIFSCPRCQRSLSVHHQSKKSHSLVCHLCGYRIDEPLACPKCQGPRLKRKGWGIQKLEQEIKKLVPDSTIGIIRNAYLDHYQEKLPDIALATSGALVPNILKNFQAFGAISADSHLSRPDFSSSEETFRQLYKIIDFFSRSGGSVLVQTHHPDHPAIKSALNLELERFYQRELEERRDFHYPPAEVLVRLLIKDKNREKLIKKTEAFYESISKSSPLPTTVELVNPGPAFIEKIRGQYRWQIIIKFPAANWPEVKRVIKLTDDDWLVDVEPLNLLN